MTWTKRVLAGSAAVALAMTTTSALYAADYKFLLMGALVHPYYGPMPAGIGP
jgi:hypothetical protein